MKTRDKRQGRTSLWDLLIVVLAGTLLYLLYTRGRLDKYLPERYTAATVLAGRGQDAPEASPPSPRAQGTPTSSGLDAARALAATPSPAPRPIRSTPTPARAAIPTATPAPAAPAAPALPASLAEIERRYWPKEISLRRPMEFMVVIGGRRVGSVKVPAGASYPLVDIRGTEVIIMNGETAQAVAAGDTDVLERITELMGRRTAR